MKIVHWKEAEKIFAFDFSNFACICHFGYQHLPPAKDGTPRGHVYGFMEKLISVLKPYYGKKVGLVFALDNKAKRKIDLYPEYKAKRKQLEFNPVPDIKRMIKYFKCSIIQCEHEEADDVLASFCENNLHRETMIDILTTDKDLWQLGWQKNIRIWNTVKKRVVLRSDLEDSFGLKDHTKIPLWKAVFGDSSDNIKASLPRIQKKLVVPLINNSDGTIESLYHQFENIPMSTFTTNAWTKIENGKEAMTTNFKIVELNRNIIYEEDDRNGNAKFLKKFMNNYGYRTFDEEIGIISGSR